MIKKDEVITLPSGIETSVDSTQFNLTRISFQLSERGDAGLAVDAVGAAELIEYLVGRMNEVRPHLEALAEHYDSEEDYFDHEGLPDTAAEWRGRADEVRLLLEPREERA